MGPPIKDEIPGLADFNANSAVPGIIPSFGIPDVDAEDDIIEEWAAHVAKLAYKVSAAMMVEKYKKNTRH